MGSCLARVSGGAFLLLVFGLIALLISGDPAVSADLKQPEAVKSYAVAWTDGSLDRVDYDPASAPDVGEADPGRIAANVEWMVRGISRLDQDRPAAVGLVGAPRKITAARGELRPGDEVQAMDVTWELDDQTSWTYRTEVAVRTTDGRQRVLWRPNVVHPALTHGLVLQARRLRTERAPVLDATGRVVPAGTATALIGTVQAATHELAETYPARVVDGDMIGISGLQHVYDAQLAGTAGIEIDVVRPEDYKPLEPWKDPVHVVPPVPGKPLRLTLDPGWQAKADAAVRQAASGTAVLALDALTGRVLAAATGGDSRDLALQGQYPPGAVFRMATTLALTRNGATPETSVDCTPLLHESQLFVNPADAPAAADTSLSTAFAQNCLTGLARLSRTLTPEQLPQAAADLGIGVPSITGANAFDGTVPATADPLGLVQNAVGEGGVLASPLAMARASATVASGTRRASTLVMPTVRPSAQPQQPILKPSEQAPLQQLMLASVQSDPQLAALRSAAVGQVSAVAGMAGYGPAASAPVHAWCTGYQGNIAFAVLVTGKPTTAATGSSRTARAAEVAAAFLG